MIETLCAIVMVLGIALLLMAMVDIARTEFEEWKEWRIRRETLKEIAETARAIKRERAAREAGKEEQ